MKTELTVEIREVYGNRTVYPVCAQSRRLAELIGTKTFTERALFQLKTIGFTLIVLGKEPVL